MTRDSIIDLLPFQHFFRRVVSLPSAMVLFCLGFATFGLLAGSSHAQPNVDITLERVISGLQNPVGLEHAGDGSGRLFIFEQGGTIRIWTGTQILPVPFLDIPVASGSERGLLGLAFHPSFASNRFLFVHYSDPGTGNTVVSRFRASAANPNTVEGGSEVVLFTQAQPFANHNGGEIAFGADGRLYIGLGDGGSAGDPQNNAQNLNSLLGKLLRFDAPANPADPNPQLGIPADNPFVGLPGRDEIWAFGLRNPFRFAFDRLNGDLFIGDVGQDRIEEISFQAGSSSGGENFGWRRMEGSDCFNPASGCNNGTLTLPILEYSHALGCSITGGHRYRGPSFPALQGIYFFGDFCTGRIWGATPDAGGNWQMTELLDTALSIASFGEDEAGDVFVVDVVNGTVDRIETEVAPPIGSCLFSADFNAGADDFTFVDDTENPEVTSGTAAAGTLQVSVGGINDADVTDMLGQWRRDCTLAASESVTLTLQARLVQTSEYENDEISQVLVNVNGVDTVLATLTGDGNGGVAQDTGLQTFDVDVTLPSGTSSIRLGCFNNKKTFNNESTACTFDNVSINPAGGSALVDANFDVGTDGLTFVEDPEDPLVTSGQRTATGGVAGSGGLEVTVGGVNNDDVTDMLGSWTRTFEGSGSFTLRIDANLSQTSEYEADEQSETRVVVDGQRFVIGQLTGNGNGGATQSTGFQSVSELLTLGPGTHRVTLECFNNKKTFNNESTTCVFDNLRIE